MCNAPSRRAHVNLRTWIRDVKYDAWQTPSARSGRASPLRRFYDMGQGTEVSTATLFAEHASASRPNYSDRSKPGFLSQCENELPDESRSGKPTVVIILVGSRAASILERL